METYNKGTLQVHLLVNVALVLAFLKTPRQPKNAPPAARGGGDQAAEAARIARAIDDLRRRGVSLEARSRGGEAFVQAYERVIRWLEENKDEAFPRAVYWSILNKTSKNAMRERIRRDQRAKRRGEVQLEPMIHDQARREEDVDLAELVVPEKWEKVLAEYREGKWPIVKMRIEGRNWADIAKALETTAYLARQKYDVEIRQMARAARLQ